MQELDPLSALYDIHLPAGPSWWPPAPGWWFITIALILTACASAYFVLRWWHKRTALRRSARQALIILQTRYKNGEQAAVIISELATLLKRIALAKYPEQNIAGLNGQAWLEFLDHTSQSQHFTKGAGRSLVTAPYRQAEAVEMTNLLDLSVQWISKNT